MKNFVLILLFWFRSTNSLAFDDGFFINFDFKNGDNSMYRALEINTKSCPNGGAIVKFYNLETLNFCHHNASKTVYKFKKCIGKEFGEFPFQKTCFGLKVNTEIIKLSSVEKNDNNDDDVIILNEVEINDNKVSFETTFILKILSPDQIKITKKTHNKITDQKASEEFLFTKN